jgi:hypothetical protein
MIALIQLCNHHHGEEGKNQKAKTVNMKRKERRGEGVWLGIVLVFSGLVFLDVVFEASLFPPDNEAYVFVEVDVAARSDVDIVAFLFMRVSFHFRRVVECFSLSSNRPWPR